MVKVTQFLLQVIADKVVNSQRDGELWTTDNHERVQNIEVIRDLELSGLYRSLFPLIQFEVGIASENPTYRSTVCNYHEEQRP